MGCFWSSEPPERNAHNRLDNARLSSSHQVYSYSETYVRAQISPKNPVQSRPVSLNKPRPLFGEYKCSACGHTWTSRLCWPNRYQLCELCKKHVYPHKQRELRASDFKDSKTKQEHKKELCQMCQQLGHYCGNNRKRDSRLRQRKLSY
ncbi:unnamed protein product [Parnassius apollo]|uniref:(apollo) hypothetical protein n=1 Tax=Parnassius apollo TaxID=110799 RepID=A0A8S3XCT1_PARAO|nr:unnamed protein product [Parnassius apollo]